MKDSPHQTSDPPPPVYSKQCQKKESLCFVSDQFWAMEPNNTVSSLMVPTYTFVWWRERQTRTELGYYGVFSIVSSRVV
jgi:hypothetical protein